MYMLENVIFTIVSCNIFGLTRNFVWAQDKMSQRMETTAHLSYEQDK